MIGITSNMGYSPFTGLAFFDFRWCLSCTFLLFAAGWSFLHSAISCRIFTSISDWLDFYLLFIVSVPCADLYRSLAVGPTLSHKYRSLELYRVVLFNMTLLNLVPYVDVIPNIFHIPPTYMYYANVALYQWDINIQKWEGSVFFQVFFRIRIHTWRGCHTSSVTHILAQ